MDTPLLALLAVAAYLGLLLLLGQRIGRKAGMADFLWRSAQPLRAVAFGMIGTSLSGVTFSVPGWVGSQQFGYANGVDTRGYAAIIGILPPLYYRLRLTRSTPISETESAPAPTGQAPLSFSSPAAWAPLSACTSSSWCSMKRSCPTSLRLGWARMTVVIAAVLGIIWPTPDAAESRPWCGPIPSDLARMLLAAGVAVVLLGQQLDLSLLEIPGPSPLSHAQWWFLEDWGAANHGVKQLWPAPSSRCA